MAEGNESRASEAAIDLYELQVKQMPSPPTRSPRDKTRRATRQKVLEQPEVSKKPSSQDKKAQPNETSEVDEAYANLEARAAALRK